ncbi:MAG: preprotein translocase subunit SecY [Anaerolineales bacterium]|nr:MAG: preprotein translocase subunit SecY [Anaerolineales bacterium]
MLQAVSNALKLPDLRRKLIFTLAILVIVRLAAHVPVPGIDSEALSRMFEANQLLGLLDMFSGGAMSNFSVMAMGVYPYITAQIILQLLQPLIPALEELSQEGEAGRNKLNQYMLWMTIPLAFLHGFGQATLLQRGGALANFGLSRATLMPSLATLATLSAGTMFAIWLGELIDEQGIGNGMSLIIFSGIVADVPGRVGALLVGNPMGLVIFLAITAVTVIAIIFIQEGQRRIPVQYAKRVRGTKIYGGQSTHIPLQVNSAGMIPLIFAVSILLLPGVVASYLVDSEIAWVASVATATSTIFNSEGTVYWVLYFVFVVGLTYFYTDVVFQQQNLAEMLRKQGGFVPGLRPGRRTAEYLNGVLRRITLVGAVFLGVIAILPFLIRGVAGTGQMLVTSTGLLIVVGTVLDTMKQLEAQLLMRHYEGFIKR